MLSLKRLNLEVEEICSSFAIFINITLCTVRFNLISNRIQCVPLLA